MACQSYRKYKRKKGLYKEGVQGPPLKRCCSPDTVELKIICRSVARNVKKTKTQILVETEKSYRDYFIAHLKILDPESVARTLQGRQKVHETDYKEVLVDFNEPIIVDFGGCGGVFLKKDPYNEIDHIVGMNPGFLTKSSYDTYYSEAFRKRVRDMLTNPRCSGVMKKDNQYSPTPNRVVSHPERYEEYYYGVTKADFTGVTGAYDWFEKLGLSESDYYKEATVPVFIHHSTGNVYAVYAPKRVFEDVSESDPNALSPRVFKIANLRDNNIYDVIKRDPSLTSDLAVNDVTCQPIESLRWFLFGKKPGTNSIDGSVS